jgi:DNA-binding NarL/FixJ family response regulator
MNHQDSYVRSLKIGHSNGGAVGLRQMAVAADTASVMEVDLALLWRELVSGLCRVVDDFFTDERCYVVLRPTFGGPAGALDGRRLEILSAVLCGQGQKNIAIDLGLAPSTIALNARLALESLGLRCKPSRVHPLLMLAAKAGSKPCGAPSATLSFIADGAEQLRVVSVPRPDRRLFRVLPPAELAVIRHLVEGLRYDEIARLRGTSTRTIANQITAVFRRMRASGRNELLTRLFFAEGLERGLLPGSTSESIGPVRGTASGDLRSA